MAIRVIIAGAKGKMGAAAVKLIQATDHMQLVAGVDSTLVGDDVGQVIGIGPIHAPFYNDVQSAFNQNNVDVFLDFTSPKVVKEHLDLAIQSGIRSVVGTTGLTADEIEDVRLKCDQAELGVVIAPNFAIGAVLMMKFAREAAKYMPNVEIIEMHHDRKLDAPSGTAVKTAEMIAEVRGEHRQGHPDEKETIDGARGAFYTGFPIHSVRLPGRVAHQEVLFGSPGETLSIKHDAIDRDSFMPGVKLAIEQVMTLNQLVVGLDKLLGDS